MDAPARSRYAHGHWDELLPAQSINKGIEKIFLIKEYDALSLSITGLPFRQRPDGTIDVIDYIFSNTATHQMVDPFSAMG